MVEEKREGKLSYKELEEVAMQLRNENIHLKEKVNSLALNGVFDKMQISLAILQIKDNFSKEFIDKVSKNLENDFSNVFVDTSSVSK